MEHKVAHFNEMSSINLKPLLHLLTDPKNKFQTVVLKPWHDPNYDFCDPLQLYYQQYQ